MLAHSKKQEHKLPGAASLWLPKAQGCSAQWRNSGTQHLFHIFRHLPPAPKLTTYWENKASSSSYCTRASSNCCSISKTKASSSFWHTSNTGNMLLTLFMSGITACAHPSTEPQELLFLIFNSHIYRKTCHWRRFLPNPGRFTKGD